MTGCLRISKESIFTGLNNFTSYSLLNNGGSEYFGFNEKSQTVIRRLSIIILYG